MTPTLIAAVEATIERKRAEATEIERRAKRKSRNERMFAIFAAARLSIEAADLRRELDQYLAASEDVGAADQAA